MPQIDSHRYSLLSPHEAPDLAPLRASFDFDDAEAELKSLFIALLTEHIRPALNDLQTCGLPHIGSDEQFGLGVVGDGLSLYRSRDVEAMRYVWESWRARNPKRGLQMLKTYLQLTWPNGWEVAQLWQSKSAPYPTDLTDDDDGGRYLTSRVMVSLSSASVGREDVERIIPALRSVIPAKILLLIRVATQFSCDMLAYPWWGGCDFDYFEGEIRPDPDPTYSGHLGLILTGGGACDMAYFEGRATADGSDPVFRGTVGAILGVGGYGVGYFEGLASTGANTGDPVFNLNTVLAAGGGAGSSFGYFEGSASAQQPITQAPAGGVILDRGNIVLDRGSVVIG
jgi:hypothetical protein